MSTHVLHPEGATVSMSDGPAGSGWGASISDEASVPKALAGAASHAEALAPLSRVASGVVAGSEAPVFLFRWRGTVPAQKRPVSRGRPLYLPQPARGWAAPRPTHLRHSASAKAVARVRSAVREAATPAGAPCATRSSCDPAEQRPEGRGKLQQEQDASQKVYYRCSTLFEMRPVSQSFVLATMVGWRVLTSLVVLSLLGPSSAFNPYALAAARYGPFPRPDSARPATGSKRFKCLGGCRNKPMCSPG